MRACFGERVEVRRYPSPRTRFARVGPLPQGERGVRAAARGSVGLWGSLALSWDGRVGADRTCLNGETGGTRRQGHPTAGALRDWVRC